METDYRDDDAYYQVIKEEKEAMKKVSKIIGIIVVIFIGVIVCTGITIIPTGYTGVKTSFGQVQETPIKSGSIAYHIPFVESIKKINNKQQDIYIEPQVWGEASDKTPVYAAAITVTYQILSDKTTWLYANVADIASLVSDAMITSAIKSAMVELSVDDVTVRSKIEPLVQKKLTEAFNQKYGEDAICVNRIVINDMNFENAYNNAIQQKSIAQQNAAKQQIENKTAIAKAEADKQVAITNAEAEAEKTRIAAEAQANANKILTDSITENLIEYQKVEKWNGKLPTVTGGNALLNIDSATE